MNDVLRPLYDEVIAKTSNGEDVVFNDGMNKFLDDLVDSTSVKSQGDVAIIMGNRITGDGTIRFGSRV